MPPLRTTNPGSTSLHRFSEIIPWQMRALVLMLSLLFGCVGTANSQTSDFGDYSGFGSASSTTLSTIKIGALTDSESAMTANTTATGDDITGSDDEDGVTLPFNLVRGQSSSLTVNVSNTSGSTAYLNVWIDFNGNGVLTDLGEQVAANTLAASGASSTSRIVTFTVPATAVLGNVGVRVRFTSTSSTGPTGISGNGEVEDHVVNIFSAPLISALSNEARVNTTTAGDQWDYIWSVRTVAAQPDGSYISVWIDTGGADGQAKGIFGQRFDAGGNRIGGEFQVNTKISGSQNNPTIAVAPDGSFAVGWDGPGNSTDAYAQLFSPTGERVGDEFLLNTTVSGNQQYPELCYFSDGTFVAAFVDSNQTVLQRFDARGRRIGQETRISSASGSVVMDSLCIRPDKSVFLTWTNAGDVYGQLFSSSLAPLGAEHRFNQYTTGNQQYSGARVDARGNIFVVWQSDGQDGFGEGVYGRLYDSNLVPRGNEFAITTNTAGNQYEPQIAVMPSGLFVVAWTDYDSNRDGGGGTPSSSVWMRLYDAAGTALGSEMMVNQSIAGYQGFPVIAMNDSGRLLVVWEGNGTQPGHIDNYGIFSRAFQLTQTGTSTMSVTPTTGTAGDLVTVTMTLASPTSTANVVPNPLALEGTAGVSATLVSGPSPASATVGTAGTSFTWTYRLTAQNLPGTLSFGGNAGNDASVIFPFAQSVGVSVKPSLFIRDLTAPNIVGDSNVKTSPGAGPNAFTIGAQVSNQGLQDLNDVVIYVGDGTIPAIFPDTTMSLVMTNNTYQGTFRLRLLANDGDATRTLATLGAAKQVIAGGIDFDGNGSVGTEDDGVLSNGISVINGGLDLNRDGIINTSDGRVKPPGNFGGYIDPAIIGGYVDVNGDGVISAADADTFGGEVATLYWQVAYETVDSFNVPTFGDVSDIGDDLRYDWTIWGSGNSGGTARKASLSDSTQVRQELSAASNKVVPSPSGFVSGSPPRIIAGYVDINSDGAITTADDGTYYGAQIIDGGVDINNSGTITTADDGSLNGFGVIDGRVDASGNNSIGAEDDIIMVQVGQTFQITLNHATFGTVGAGYDANRDGLSDFDLWYQPVGEPDFNANSFRLIDIQANITGSGGSNPLNGITTIYSNEPYLSRLIGDVSGGFNATYTYTWVVMGPGRTVLSPYHQAGSGTNNVKYSGDYGINVVATTGTSQGLSLSKSGGPNPTLINGTTTWTMNYQNTSNTPIGNPSSGNPVVIEDAIPANTTYVAGSASSATYPTLIQYSTDGGATWTSTQPAAASVNRVRWLVDQAVPVADSGSVSFQTTVNSGTASQTSIPNQAVIRSGDGPVIATANASITAVGTDFGDMSLFGLASSITLPSLRIGTLIDEESSPTTNASATGDDLTGVDDEDGVTAPASVMGGASSSLTVNVTNTSGSEAFLNVWIDFNRNGVLTDADEQVAVNTSIANGTSNSNRTVNFTVPSNASAGVAGIRVRLTSTSTPGATGAVGNGEVEDMVFTQVICQPLTLSPATLAAGTLGSAYSQTFSTAGGVAPYSYALTSGTLPAGLTLSSAGVLSGTPTTSNGAGTSITIRAADANGCSGTRSYTLQICPVITLTPATLPNGMAYSAYSQTISASGGAAPYVFALASGSLPAGLSLNTSTGVISGRPNSTTVASFTISATDANACTGTRACTLTPASPTDMGDFASFGSASSTVITTLRIGASTDAEATATTNVSATGDDLTDLDDEDGLTVPASAPLSTSSSLTVNVTNTTGSSVFLNVWIDFNRNGVLTDSGEQVAVNTTVATGTSNTNRTINFTVPAAASLGVAGVRVRLTSTNSPGATGFSGNGEVEDTVITLACPAITVNPATLTNPTVGTANSQTISASDSTTTFTYSVSAGSLPAGMTLNTASGVISGTPTSSATANFTLTATGANTCVGSRSYTVTPVCPTVSLTPATVPASYVGSAYSQSLTASGGTAPYTFAVSVGTLPTGLALSSAGVLSGTPTTGNGAGVNVTIRATDIYGCQGSLTYVVQVCPVIGLSPASLINGTVGTAYSQTVSGAGGAAPYNFAVSSGALPTWATLDAATGALTGTPNSATAASFTLRATDANGCQGTQAYTLTPVCPAISIAPVSATQGVVGSAYTQTLTGSGGIAPYGTWTVTSGTLPTGLTLNASTGVISGTPTVSASPATSITVRVNDTYGCQGSQVVTLQICPVITLSPASLSNGTVGTAYSQTVSGAGGAAPYNFAVSSGALPTWATLDAATGALTGTPNSATAASFTLRATDANGCRGTRAYTITPVCPAISIAPASATQGVVGTAYTQTLTGSGGAAPYGSWTVTAGSLPAGLALSTAGVISGTPTATASPATTVTVSTTDTYGCQGTQVISVQICPFVTVSPASLINGTVGTAYSQTVSASSGSGAYTFAISAGALPTWATLNAATGAITGTPNSSTAASFTLRATDANGCQGTRAYTITPVCPTISITPESLSNGTVGMAYSQTVTASGGTAAYSYSVTSGALPTGLILSSAGVLSGTPTSTASATFVVTAADANGCTGTRPFMLTPEPGLDYGDYSLFGSASSKGYTTVRMGASIDKEGAQMSNIFATGDDLTGSDDEDGVIVPASATVGGTNTLIVNVTNTNGTSAYLNAWIDFNHNGILTDPGEQVTSNQTVANGVNNVNRYLSFVVPSNASIGDVGVRVRITSTANPGPTGSSGNGEVEDHLLTIVADSDYGDHASLGIASSAMSLSLLIGSSVDAEPAAVTDGLASGDDLSGMDDEDGVTLPSVVEQGTSSTMVVNVTNTTASTAFLNVWVDWNNNGVLTDSGEQLATNLAVASGAIAADQAILFTVPSSIASGVVPLRIRLTTTSTTLSVGSSGNGEVEDHLLKIAHPSQEVGNLVFVDANGNNRFDLGEGRDDVTIELYEWGDTPGVAQPVAVTNTASGGLYLFDRLWEGQYFAHLPAQQFEPAGNLRGMLSLPGFSVSDDDAGEDSLDSNEPWITGISTGLINLVRDGAPTDADIETGFGSSTDIDDRNTDMTVDFGLYRPVGLGNLVFDDINSNGHYDPGEGVAGVRLELYTDLQYPGVDLPQAYTTSDSAGRYGFNLLLPGNYFVHIPASQFQSGGTLYQRISILEGLVGDDDVGEDGVNNGDPAVNGVSSLVISLYPGNAPTDHSGESGFEHASDNQIDAAVDLTVDFGFQTPVGVGNLVYFDRNENGFADGGEGVNGVTVDLYRADQTPGFGLPIFTRITANGGRYFFDSLPSGDYRLHIPASQFEPGRPLHGLESAAVASNVTAMYDDDTPGNENGIDDPMPFRNGISSAVFTLAVNAEPTDSNGETGAFKTIDSFDDDNFNLTIDFGFALNNPNGVGVGNLVFVDVNGNNVYDAGEGIDGVKMQLFNATADVHAANPIATVISNNGGSYIFSNLVEGDYKIFIPASEFAAGKPLSGWRSLPGYGGDNGVDDNVDENGIDVADPSATGAESAQFHLAPGDEPTDSLGEFGSNAFMDDTNDANTDLTIDFGFFRSVAVGNLVFIDANYNGRADAGEGAGGVTLELYNESAFIPFDAPVATTTTDTDGSYLFSDLTPGRYFVRVPSWQFDFGSSLYGYASVLGTQSGDDSVGEDGLDNGSPSINGIQTAVIDLTPTNAPTGSQEGGYQGSSDDINDASTNLTVDLGFVLRSGVGNVVFNDLNNDGLFDPGTENGIDGVTVELWSNQANATTAVGSTTTYGGGLYTFSVAPGSYYVKIPASNFQDGGALTNRVPSKPVVAGSVVPTTTAGDDDTKQDGYTTGSVLSDGARTAVFTLVPGQSPTAATTETGYSSESDDFDDANVDLTIDLGFAPKPLSVGNLIFRDVNSNGHYDSQDFGVAGVKVRLFKVGDNPATKAPVMETTTSIGGAFLLNTYAEGQYFLIIPASEFATGAALNGTTSAPGFGIDNGKDDDVDENGLDTVSPMSTGVSSTVFDLAFGAEPLESTGESGFLASQDEGNDDDADLTIDLGFVTSLISPLAATETRNLMLNPGTASAPATFTAWQSQNGLSGLNSPNDDPDGDGLTNLMEYALGTAAGNGLGASRFTLVSNTVTGAFEALLTRPAGSHADLRYYLEGSNDLTTWTTLSFTPVTTSNADQTETLRYTQVESAFNGSPRGFLRIKVALDANLDGTPEATASSGAQGWARMLFPVGRQSLSMPLTLPAVYTGRISTVSARDATINTSGLDIQTQFHSSAGYYAEVLDGILAGHTFEIDTTSSSGSTLVLTTAGGSGLSGARICIRPHWSLGSLIPESSLQPADTSETADRILFFDNNANRFEINWICAGTSAVQWVRDGDSSLTDNGPRVIPPQAGLIVQIRRTPVTLTFIGEIRGAPLALPQTTGTHFIGTGLALPLAPGSQPHASGSSLRLWSGDTDPASGYYQTYVLDSESRWIEESTGLDVTTRPLLDCYRAFFVVKP